MRQQLRPDLFGRHTKSQRSEPQFNLLQEPRQNSITSLLQQGSSSTRNIVARTNVGSSILPQLRNPSPAVQVKQITEEKLNVENINVLIQRCATVYPPVYYCNTYQFSPTSSVSFEKALKDFRNLLVVVQSPSGLQKIGAKNLYPFLHMLQLNLFHPISFVPDRIIYGDVVPNITEANWPIVDTCYSIFIIVLRGLDSQILSSIINEGFLSNLLFMLNSPDKREQNAVETLTYSIVEFNPNLLSYVINYISRHLLNYLTGAIQFFSVSVSLKILRQVFKSKYFQNTECDILEMARNVIIPLFNTTFANEFYQQLTSLCSLIYESDSSTASYSLNYLFTHWPFSNSAKTTIFLNHIVIASGYLKPASRDIAESVFRFITDAIISDNFKVTVTALQICGDLHFYSFFLPYLKVLSPTLLSALQAAKGHWNEDVRTKTAEVLKIVEELISHSDKMEDCTPSFKKPRTQSREEVWKMIALMAKS